MSALRLFEDYLEKEIIIKIRKDIERAKSLVIEAERKNNSVKERLEKIGVKNENANDYIEHCYDIIMFLIRARLYLEGYKSSGQGAHEAEISYLRNLKFNEKDIQFTDQLRYFRNGMLYYGTLLDKEYAEKVLKFLERIYPKLKQKHL